MLIAILPVISYGQEEFRKHQIGMNLGKFIPIFRTQSTNFDLNYYYHLDSTYAFRLGVNYSRQSGDDGNIDLGYRVGVQRTLKKASKMTIYTGLDFNHDYQKHYIDDRSLSSVGGAVFLGARYQVKSFLSFSTEPGFYWFYIVAKDPTSFSEKKRSRNESRLTNVGQFLISFHF